MVVVYYGHPIDAHLGVRAYVCTSSQWRAFEDGTVQGCDACIAGVYHKAGGRRGP